jgi:translocation and assembly module TamB
LGSSYRILKLDRKLGYLTALFPVKNEAVLGVQWLYAGSGSVDVTGSAGDTLDLNAALRNVPASLIATVVPTLAPDGTISGTVTVRGTPAAPVVTCARLANAAVAQTRSTGIGRSVSPGRFRDGWPSPTPRSPARPGSACPGRNVQPSGQRPIAMKFTGTAFAALTGMLSRQVSCSKVRPISMLRLRGLPHRRSPARCTAARLIDVRRNLLSSNRGDRYLAGNRARHRPHWQARQRRQHFGGGTIDILSPGLPADRHHLDKAAMSTAPWWRATPTDS